MTSDKTGTEAQPSMSEVSTIPALGKISTTESGRIEPDPAMLLDSNAITAGPQAEAAEPETALNEKEQARVDQLQKKLAELEEVVRVQTITQALKQQLFDLAPKGKDIGAKKELQASMKITEKAESNVADQKLLISNVYTAARERIAKEALKVEEKAKADRIKAEENATKGIGARAEELAGKIDTYDLAKLTTKEFETLEKIEAKIRAAVEKQTDATLDMAKHLLEIRDKKLYRNFAGGFAEYCQVMWHLTVNQGNRLVRFGLTLSQLEKLPEILALPAPKDEAGQGISPKFLPKNEAQARALQEAGDTKAQQVVWVEIAKDVAHKPELVVTAKVIDEYVQAHKAKAEGRQAVIDGAPKPSKPVGNTTSKKKRLDAGVEADLSSLGVNSPIPVMSVMTTETVKVLPYKGRLYHITERKEGGFTRWFATLVTHNAVALGDPTPDFVEALRLVQADAKAFDEADSAEFEAKDAANGFHDAGYDNVAGGYCLSSDDSEATEIVEVIRVADPDALAGLAFPE